jgi:hypothetical protein
MDFWFGVVRHAKPWYGTARQGEVFMTSTFQPIAPASNGAKETIEIAQPYRVLVTLEGSAAILLHGWNNESVEAKAKSAKNSRAKKSDNLESYIYRDQDGSLALPGTYLHGALINAAKYVQDPRSPRKSGCDLVRAAIVPLDDLAAFHGPLTVWDYVDRRRVTIQRNAITRERPALRAGWRITFELMVLVPEYVDTVLLRRLLTDAGRLVGIGDFRPTYGRFDVVSFEVDGK